MLRSNDGKLKLQWELTNPTKAEHRGWISYKMVFSHDGDAEFVFESTDDAPLFLDALIEPEIPTICRGIRDAIRNRTCFNYEPIDERDFRLVVDAQKELPLVSIQFTDASIPIDFQWSSGVEVTASELVSFISAIEAQFYLMIAGQ